jgi:hypothetical protein
MCRPGIGAANQLFCLWRVLWRPMAPASRTKSCRTAEESRTRRSPLMQIQFMNLLWFLLLNLGSKSWIFGFSISPPIEGIFLNQTCRADNFVTSSSWVSDLSGDSLRRKSIPLSLCCLFDRGVSEPLATVNYFSVISSISLSRDSSAFISDGW